MGNNEKENEKENVEKLIKEGDELFNAGDYKRALEKYALGYELDKKNILNKINKMGNELYSQGKYQEAIGYYDKAIELDPEYKYAWYNKGNSLDDLGKYQEAIECYDRAIELDPKYKYAWNGKGISLNNLGKYQEAIECCDRAIEIDTKFIDAWCNKGNSLKNLGKYQEAIECYDRAIEIDPKYKYVWNGKGISLKNLEKYQEAIECYDRAIEIDPENKYTLNNKGISLDNLGRYQEAIECYDRAIEIDTKFIDAWNNKGNSLYNLGKYQDAVKCYDRAIELDPEYEYAWNNKGNSLYNLGKYQEAIECYERAIKLEPKLKESWNGKGISLNALGKYKEAIKCYKRAIKIDPEYAYAFNNKGNSLCNLWKYQEAIGCYDRAIEIGPEYVYAYAWSNKGNSLWELKRYKEAFRSFDEALKFEGDTKKKRGIILNKAKLHVVSSDYSGAIKEVAELIKENPVSIFKEVGLSEKGAKNKKKSKGESKDKPLLDEYHAGGLMILGTICLFNKKFDKAIEYFKQANHIEPYKILPVLWSFFTRYLKLCISEEEKSGVEGEKNENNKEKNKKPSAEGVCRIHDLEEATSIILELENLKEFTDDPEHIAHISHWLGLLFYRTGDFFTSAQYFNKAIDNYGRNKKFKQQKERVKFLLREVWYRKLPPNIFNWWFLAPQALFRKLKRVIASVTISFISIMLLAPFFPNLQLGNLPLPKWFSKFIPVLPEWIYITVAVSALLLVFLIPFISKISFKGVEVELRPQAPEITLSPVALFTLSGMMKLEEPKQSKGK